MSLTPSLYDYALAVSSIFGGTALIIWPGPADSKAITKHKQRLADREARGTDAYFEEKRSIEAYKPFKAVWKYRLLGFVLTILGAAYLALLHFTK